MFMVQGNVRKQYKFLVYKIPVKLSMFGNNIINKLQMWNINVLKLRFIIFGAINVEVYRTRSS